MSGKFDFRLEKVLNYREEKEKAAQSQLAKAQYSLQSSLQELSGLKTELLEVYKRQKEENGGLDISSRLLSSRYTEYLAGCISSTEQAVQAKEAQVMEERRHLGEKIQDRKVLSTLKEKKQLAYHKENDLAEQKMNDEFAITNFCRK